MTSLRPDSAWLAEVEAHSENGVSRCYQCRKCTNGCPVTFTMDIMPNQIMRMIQLGLREEVLRSKTIWICASCQTCTTRCPNEIEIAHLMDTLRQLSRKDGNKPAEEKVAMFHDAFLDSIRRHGRVFELGMLGKYKMAARDPFGNARLGWEMFRKGKIKFLPANCKGRREVRAMFGNARKG